MGTQLFHAQHTKKGPEARNHSNNDWKVSGHDGAAFEVLHRVLWKNPCFPPRGGPLYGWLLYLVHVCALLWGAVDLRELCLPPNTAIMILSRHNDPVGVFLLPVRLYQQYKGLCFHCGNVSWLLFVFLPFGVAMDLMEPCFPPNTTTMMLSWHEGPSSVSVFGWGA